MDGSTAALDAYSVTSVYVKMAGGAELGPPPSRSEIRLNTSVAALGMAMRGGPAGWVSSATSLAAVAYSLIFAKGLERMPNLSG